ncbi:MAG: bifunctional diguanylate cyclase/phosphodiesterase [Gammaproteobacteria bacterium]|nr:bifunctional diguanylate cyclase/phosphodiesterase [Gammaproteobacteria bacterium]
MDLNIREFVTDFVEGSDWSEGRLISFHESLEAYQPAADFERAWRLLGQAKLHQIFRSPKAIICLGEATKTAIQVGDKELTRLCDLEYLTNHYALRASDNESSGQGSLDLIAESSPSNQRTEAWLDLIKNAGRHSDAERAALIAKFKRSGDKIGVAHTLFTKLIKNGFLSTDFNLDAPSSVQEYDIEAWLYCRTNDIAPLYFRASANLLYTMSLDKDVDLETVEAFYAHLGFESRHPFIQQLGVWKAVFENLAANYSTRGQMQIAEYWLDKALNHAKQFTSEVEWISVLNEIAHHYARKGDAELTLKWAFEYSDVYVRCATRDVHLAFENRRQAHLIEIATLRETEMLRRTEQLEDNVAQRTEQLEQEIERRRQAEEEAYHIAFHSAVTGLLNRSWMLKHIEQFVAPNQTFAACYIDLNGFKQINDRYSHAAGDQVLKESARRIKSAVAPAHYVIHLAGDEFVVLAPNQTAIQLQVYANQIQRAFQDPVITDSQTISVGLSMGIASGRYCEGSALAFLESKLKQADLAMYSAKGSERQTIVEFNSELANKMRIEQTFLAEFETYLNNHKLEFYCQPQLEIKSGEVIGGELLLRWPHSDIGIIYPDQFIHLIKQREQFDQLVMQSLSILATLQTQHPTLKFSINLTATQLASAEFMNQVIAACATHDIAPERLTFELTESDLMDAESDAVDLMHQAKDRGFSFALDDIGKGHNSLLVFSQFPFDYIKIDRQLAQSAPTSKSAQAVIRGLVATCNSLGINTVIEGVETEEELAFAAGAGIDSVQGFFLSTPLPTGEAFNDFVYHSQQAIKASGQKALIADRHFAH